VEQTDFCEILLFTVHDLLSLQPQKMLFILRWHLFDFRVFLIT